MLASFFGMRQQSLPYPQREMFVIFDATASANGDCLACAGSRILRGQVSDSS